MGSQMGRALTHGLRLFQVSEELSSSTTSGTDSSESQGTPSPGLPAPTTPPPVTPPETTPPETTPPAPLPLPPPPLPDQDRAVTNDAAAWTLLDKHVPGPPCETAVVSRELCAHVTYACDFVHLPGQHAALSTRLSLVLQGIWRGQLCALKLSPASCASAHDAEVATLLHLAASAGSGAVRRHLPTLLSTGEGMRLGPPNRRVRACVMPWYPRCLHDVILSRQLTPALAWQVVLAAKAVLQFAHALGVTNCDIKPENVLLAEDGSPIIADWNLAHLQGGQLAQWGSRRAARGVASFRDDLARAAVAVAAARAAPPPPPPVQRQPPEGAARGSLVGTRGYCPPTGYPANCAADMFRVGALMFAMLYTSEPVYVNHGHCGVRSLHALTPAACLANDVAFATLMRRYLSWPMSWQVDDTATVLDWQEELLPDGSGAAAAAATHE